jgi:hypothetical protein
MCGSRRLDVVLACVLGASAVTKGMELWLDPAVALGPFSVPRNAMAILVGIELALSLLLVSGIWSRWLRRTCILLFSAFALVATWLAISGAASCGCFGRLHVPPAFTAGLDALLVLALWRSGDHRPAGSSPSTWRRILAGAGIAVGMAAALLLSFRAPDVAGAIASAAPVTQTGRFDPAAAGVSEVARGRWVVVLYRSDCPHCKTHLGEWASLARLDQDMRPRRWAFMNVDAATVTGDLLDQYPTSGLLRLRKAMPEASTPTTVVLRDGVVQRVYGAPDVLLGGG